MALSVDGHSGEEGPGAGGEVIGVDRNPAEASRRLEDCAAVILIVYTVPPEALAKGYEPWLACEDNPFFNSIPGIRHYANWKIAGIERGDAPVWTHFDFLGMATGEDLPRVWFSDALDAFRKGWIAKWGYGAGERPEAFGYAYLMEPVGLSERVPTGRAGFTWGRGRAPEAGTLWRVTETLRKHYTLGPAAPGERWRVPAADYNPLGFDWLALGDHRAGALSVAAERIAGPDA